MNYSLLIFNLNLNFGFLTAKCAKKKPQSALEKFSLFILNYLICVKDCPSTPLRVNPSRHCEFVKQYVQQIATLRSQ
ncbi:MAG: hypothetical protein CVU08_12070 [Bacteroidetes bacterium HGW-Bacteroidetes-3]|nr:MAG: hypothetical protein CVU08_12070 [Bacteroidetes bacterium HGW-Bacteroidetes-3]